MADLTASVITLANAALVAVDRTIRYVKEVKGINSLRENLLANLIDLHNLIRTITETYNRESTGDIRSASHYVGQSLRACQDCLDRLKELVVDLAALEADTLKQKMKAKRQSDKSKKEIQEIVSSIHKHMKHIQIGLGLWTLEEQKAIRRISEAMAEQQAHRIRTDLQDTLETITPIRRTMSDAETVYGQDTQLDLWRASTTFSIHSRPSITSSPTVPITPSERSNSIVSASSTGRSTATNTTEKFHAQISSCFSDDLGIYRIRDMLQLHPEPSKLANSVDTWGRTPLHTAAQHGDTTIAQLLCEYGADINAKDAEPSSVLDIAVAGKQRSFVQFLIKNKVDESNVRNSNAKDFQRMKRAIVFEQNAAKKKVQSLNLDSRNRVVL